MDLHLEQIHSNAERDEIQQPVVILYLYSVRTNYWLRWLMQLNVKEPRGHLITGIGYSDNQELSFSLKSQDYIFFQYKRSTYI